MTTGYVAPADSYRPGQPVWIRRGYAWRPGEVVNACARTVMVRYQPGEHPGTAVDTVTTDMVVPRTGGDPPIAD